MPSFDTRHTPPPDHDRTAKIANLLHLSERHHEGDLIDFLRSTWPEFDKAQPLGNSKMLTYCGYLILPHLAETDAAQARVRLKAIAPHHLSSFPPPVILKESKGYSSLVVVDLKTQPNTSVELFEDNPTQVHQTSIDRLIEDLIKLRKLGYAVNDLVKDLIYVPSQDRLIVSNFHSIQQTSSTVEQIALSARRELEQRMLDT